MEHLRGAVAAAVIEDRLRRAAHARLVREAAGARTHRWRLWHTP